MVNTYKCTMASIAMWDNQRVLDWAAWTILKHQWGTGRYRSKSLGERLLSEAGMVTHRICHFWDTERPWLELKPVGCDWRDLTFGWHGASIGTSGRKPVMNRSRSSGKVPTNIYGLPHEGSLFGGLSPRCRKPNTSQGDLAASGNQSLWSSWNPTTRTSQRLSWRDLA